MIAKFRHALVAKVEPSVSGWRAIAAYHEERIVSVEPVSQHSEHVENASIHRPDLVGMVVPQNPIDVSDCLANIVTVCPIDRPKPLTSMDVVERDRPPSERDCWKRIYNTNSSSGDGSTKKPTTA